MSEYYPDRWKIVKITGSDPHYRVFGYWYGGFTGGDSWKMNSGIVSVAEDEDAYTFKGHSGSEYRCHKDYYGTSAYGESVLQQYTEANEGAFEVLHEMPDIMNMTW